MNEATQFDMFDCPFCDGKFGISFGVQAVVHSIPYCEKFEKEDAMIFLRNARVALVGRLPDDDEWPLPTRNEGEPS